MTLEQLAIFIAVAEREHLSRGAESLGLTPSAASAAIKTLETTYDVHLFDRVGRRIELTRAGRVFLEEARHTLAAVNEAKGLLSELGGLRTGHLDIEASQTIANYWLPNRLMRFCERHPGITLGFRDGNTANVVQAVISGRAELGFIEGTVDEPALAAQPFLADELVIVMAQRAAAIAARTTLETLHHLTWVMRERGSGTRAEFEAALDRHGIDCATLPTAATLPTNEAVLGAVRGSSCAAALSKLVVSPFIAAGELVVLDIPLAPRQFTLLRHKERRLSAAALEFERICREPA
ncbi:LysR substrate-binding domain-containing protein [Thalassobaculum sp. OXR-137]|uniref:LysR substrate-binding domain-containing protein n=1 Tax=Thalassobaculum sp. OXR-137 TaxID=3100173 RepID=UPI002AC8E3E5|nr:LysR substrate-binding domain-containing protein [Thalassobaculum sp. OXR-137]WPZ36678.1 LysR substrate-binding domain-containing protein [Thalassobaculum sp. OXR-137]